MVDVYNTEAERRAALAELTALRRELKTETAKGAKAAQSDPRFIAAQERLDAAKSAAGMRTSAEDLAALNRISTADTGTTVSSGKGKVTAAGQTKAEQAVTKELNAPSRQYFNQIKQAYKNPERPPTWDVPKQITPEEIEDYRGYGTDASKARYDWIWAEDKKGQGRWAVGLVGLLQEKPADLTKAKPLDIFYSDTAPLAEARQIKNQPSWNATWNNISLDELEKALPNISYSQFQEAYYRLTLERDTDITVQDIVKKYKQIYGEG